MEKNLFKWVDKLASIMRKLGVKESLLILNSKKSLLLKFMSAAQNLCWRDLIRWFFFLSAVRIREDAAVAGIFLCSLLSGSIIGAQPNI